jgi:hypothetical protein
MSDEAIEVLIEAAAASLLCHWDAMERDADDLGEREHARFQATQRLRQLSDLELERHILPLADDPRAERRALTFGLAQSRLDAAHPSAEAVREALHARIEDPHEECRGEAWTGLAIARDPRVVPLIHDALAGRRTCWLALEAIEEWPRREYVEALARAAGPWGGEAIAFVRSACERAEE